MSTFQKSGSSTWTYEFVFRGQRIRESSGTHNKALARQIERKRHLELQEGAACVKRAKAPAFFSSAADAYVKIKKLTLAPSTMVIETYNVRHLKKTFGDQMLAAISAQEIADYQQLRIGEGAAPKSVNLEIGTLRAILRRAGAWEILRPDVKMLSVGEEVGRAISLEEEIALLDACRNSSSPLLYPFVGCALFTGMRFNTVRLLRWWQLDLKQQMIHVGKDKTAIGSRRVIPMNDRAFEIVSEWALKFPKRGPDDYVFPAASVVMESSTELALVRTDFNPSRPVGHIKTAWETAKVRAGKTLGGKDAPALECRFHDLRHTCCSRMVASGAALPMVARIMGWSASTMMTMIRRYSHFYVEELRATMAHAMYPPKSPLLTPKRRTASRK